MLKSAENAVKYLLNTYPRWKCKKEFRTQTFTRFNERPVEFSFVFRKLGEIYPRTVLDVGTGLTALPHLMRNCGCLVTAADNVSDYWPSGMFNRHYHIIDDDIVKTHLSDTFDLITCVSVLEHIQNPDSAVRNMFSLLNPGGHIILTCPYSERSYVRNVYELPGSSYGQDSPYITQSFSRSELDKWVRDNGGAVIEQEYWQFWEGEHWTVGEPDHTPEESHRGRKTSAHLRAYAEGLTRRCTRADLDKIAMKRSMVRRSVSVVIAILLFAACDAASADVDLLITNATLFDARRGVVMEGVAVSVVDGVIRDVQRSESLEGSRARRVIDAGGRLLTPGLIDTHGHLIDVLATSFNAGGGGIADLNMAPDSIARIPPRILGGLSAFRRDGRAGCRVERELSAADEGLDGT